MAVICSKHNKEYVRKSSKWVCLECEEEKEDVENGKDKQQSADDQSTHNM